LAVFAFGRAGWVGVDGRLTGTFFFFIARLALPGREEEFELALVGQVAERTRLYWLALLLGCTLSWHSPFGQS
jgi:hypothetical protein